VELLISMLLGTIIVGAVIGILMVYVFDFEQTDDITAARQRGEMVLAILQNPVLHAGLGIPNSSPDFADSFNNLSGLPDETIIPSTGDAGNIINLCYSMPSKSYTSASYDIDSDATSFDITLETIPSGIDISDVIKAWVILPTADIPFQVTNVNTTTKRISGNIYHDNSIFIAQYDELHYLRSLEAKVVDGEFYVRENLDGSGFQPRVDGIEQIYFKNNNGILTVYVLARGNKKDSDFATEVVHGWPSDEVAIDNAVKDKGYRLVTVRGSWRIRN